jgi:hypothetical protein
MIKRLTVLEAGSPYKLGLKSSDYLVWNWFAP